MNRKSIRRVWAALALAAGIGLCQPGMAQQNGDDEETPTLESLMQELQKALARMQSLEDRIGALRAYLDAQDRKTLVPRLAEGLSRSTETPVFSKQEGERLIAEAQAALDEANAALAEAGDDAVATAAAATLVAEAQTLLDSVERYPGLAELLPDSDIRFPALSATLGRDYEDRRVFPTDDAHVAAISSDGGGGFHVTYTIGGEEQTVHYAANDWRGRNFQKVDEDGELTEHLLWSHTDSFRREDANRNQGSTEFSYFDGHGSLAPGGYRFYISYGARTQADGISAGTATYAGRMAGERWSRTDPIFATGRSYISGYLNLTADFGDGAIEGRINRIYIDPPGQNNGVTLPSSTRFDIGRGRIVDGQFTATLTGVDTNPDAAIDDTVAGYKGDILGEFYGPDGEEVGGVLNAESDAHDSVIGGWFGGRKLRSVVPAGESSAPSSAGLDRDFSDSTVREATESGVTSISSDGAGGYNVTYRIDGLLHSVRLAGSAFGAHSRFPTSYQEGTDTHEYYLYSPLGSFFGRSEYDHFDVVGWVPVVLPTDGSGNASRAARGYAVHGVRTESADLPAGEASYDGRMRGEIWNSDNPNSGSRTLVRGDLSLTADFGDDTVSGTIDGIETRALDQTAYQSSTEVLTIGAGTITDSTFAATLTGTGAASSRYEGDVDGQFFGPDAIEVGGVLQATHTGNDKVLIGWFGGKRDDVAEVATSE